MQARTLPAVRGVFWIVGGFRLYQRNPPLLTTVTLAYLTLALVFGLLQPIGPFFLPLLLPMIMAVIANACRAIDQGLPVPRGALVAGLREQRHSLLRLGVLQLLATLAVLVLDQVLPGGDLNTLGNANRAAGSPAEKLDASEMLLPMLRLVLIALPMILTFWFAPLLTAWNGVPAAKSVFFSLVAVWRNWRAFVVYAMTAALVGVFTPALLLLIVGLISSSALEIFSVALRMLLLLMFLPVLMTGGYQSYRDVFAPEPAPEADTRVEAEADTEADTEAGKDG